MEIPDEILKGYMPPGSVLPRPVVEKTTSHDGSRWHHKVLKTYNIAEGRTLRKLPNGDIEDCRSSVPGIPPVNEPTHSVSPDEDLEDKMAEQLLDETAQNEEDKIMAETAEIGDDYVFDLPRVDFGFLDGDVECLVAGPAGMPNVGSGDPGHVGDCGLIQCESCAPMRAPTYMEALAMPSAPDFGGLDPFNSAFDSDDGASHFFDEALDVYNCALPQEEFTMNKDFVLPTEAVLYERGASDFSSYGEFGFGGLSANGNGEAMLSAGIQFDEPDWDAMEAEWRKIEAEWQARDPHDPELALREFEKANGFY